MKECNNLVSIKRDNRRENMKKRFWGIALMIVLVVVMSFSIAMIGCGPAASTDSGSKTDATTDRKSVV